MSCPRTQQQNRRERDLNHSCPKEGIKEGRKQGSYVSLGTVPVKTEAVWETSFAL